VIIVKPLLTLDVILSQRFTLSPETRQWRMARIVAHLGDGPYIFGVLGIIYLIGWVTTTPYLRLAAFNIMVAIVLVMAVVTTIKYLIRRQRPHPPGEFVQFPYDKYSFPSGHSARMAALAVSTLFFYLILGWILIGVALGVAAARVAVGIHYVSDILVGLGTGVVVSWTVISLLLYLL